jgi:hypothetical protein
MAQQRHHLVAFDQDPGGIADQQLADRLVSRVIRSKADRQRFFRFIAEQVGVDVGRLALLQRRRL